MGKAFLRVLIGFLILLVLLLLLIIYNLFAPPTRAASSALLVPYSDVLDAVRKDGVHEVLIQGRELTVSLKPGYKAERVTAYMPEDPTLIPDLAERGVRIVAKADEADMNPVLHYLLSWVPLLVLLSVLIYFPWRILDAINRIEGKVDTIQAQAAAHAKVSSKERLLTL